MYQCPVCFEYGSKPEVCKWCSCECLEWVQPEDVENWNGYFIARIMMANNVYYIE